MKYGIGVAIILGYRQMPKRLFDGDDLLLSQRVDPLRHIVKSERGQDILLANRGDGEA